jgi:hypothetical protein
MQLRILKQRNKGNNVAQNAAYVQKFAIELRAVRARLLSMSLHSLFTEHPASVGETYGEHLLAATGFALRLILGGLACLVHAWLPFLFQRTASNCVAELHQRMVARQRRPQASAQMPPRAIRRAATR